MGRDLGGQLINKPTEGETMATSLSTRPMYNHADREPQKGSEGESSVHISFAIKLTETMHLRQDTPR